MDRSGLHRYVGPPVSTAIAPNQRGMPLNLFSPGIITILKEKVGVADAVGPAFFKDSVSYLLNVRQIPLKPEVDPATQPALAAVLRESRDGMRTFFPLGMVPENIGSNRGLLLLLKDLFGVQPRPGHFSFLSADCNIFLRLLKVRVCVS